MNGWTRARLAAGLWIGWLAAAPAFAEDPFRVTVERSAHARTPAVKVRFEIPPGHVLYPEAIAVATVSGEALAPLWVPAAPKRPDPFTGEPKPLYAESFDALYALPPAGLDAVQVSYQGCNDRVCFMPQTRTLSLSGAATPPPR